TRTNYYRLESRISDSRSDSPRNQTRPSGPSRLRAISQPDFWSLTLFLMTSQPSLASFRTSARPSALAMTSVSPTWAFCEVILSSVARSEAVRVHLHRLRFRVAHSSSCVGVDERRNLEVVGHGDACRFHPLRQRAFRERTPSLRAWPEIRDPDLVANLATGVKQEARWNRQREHLRVQPLVGGLVGLERERHHHRHRCLPSI